MPAATGTLEIVGASSTLNRIGEACSMGALITNHKGTNAAAKTNHSICFLSSPRERTRRTTRLNAAANIRPM